MRRAFLSPNGLQQFVSSIVSRLTQSNTIDEFIYCKQLFSEYLELATFVLKPTQFIDVPNISRDARTNSDVRAFITKTKQVLSKMQFPTRDYNPMNMMEALDPQSTRIILNSDIIAINEVDNLASAFHTQYMGLNIPMLAVDQLIKTNANIIGCIVDNSAVEIKDTLNTLTTAYNAEGLYTNYFLHIHQMYAISPFANVIFIRQAAQ